jgi:PEGA domain-containing protein
MKTVVVSTILFLVVFSMQAVASAKKKSFAYPPEQVFEAALKSATEHHVVSLVDDKHLMFTFETGHSMSSWAGFKCNVTIESREDGKSAEMVLNPQAKESGRKQAFAWGAGGRIGDDMFGWTEEKLKSGIVLQKQEEKATVSPAPASAAEPATLQVTSTPDGAEVNCDGNFVGNTPSTLKLEAGKHTVRVTATGSQDWSRDISLQSGSIVHLNAALQPTAQQVNK